jgi:hypothetical protein
MVSNLAHIMGCAGKWLPLASLDAGVFDVTNGYFMRALLSSDWFLPMLGGFAIGGIFVFGSNPVFAALF